MSSQVPQTPRVRVGVVVVEGDRLLLVRHVKGDDTYWLVPGGGLDWGETIAQCAARELEEETGLSVAVKQYLYLSEAIAPDGRRHIVNVFVRAEVMGGTLAAPDEPAIAEVAWVPFAELGNIRLYPAIADQLIASWRAGFEDGMCHLDVPWK